MPPDADEKMRVILCAPFDRPIHGGFKAIMRNGVHVDIVDPLKMFDQCFELVMACDDGLSVDTTH